MAKTTTYTTVVGKIGTSMQVVYAPPSSVNPGEIIPFGGKLVDQWGAGLGGKTINLVVDGVTVMPTSTNIDGTWSFYSFMIWTPGSHTIYAEFPGDAVYAGCPNDPAITGLGPPPPVLIGVGVAALAIAGIAIRLRRK